ncbi:MAG: alpha-amylase family glycosyl hydrolase [Bacteroidales bacterium]|nr:alpha-amylase family glycosyl hydrolase [Bacteroidales bacterium]
MKRLLLLISILICFVSCSRQEGKVQLRHPEWAYNSVVYEMNVRQITPEGSFSAAAMELPMLKETGVDIIWLMPVHPIGVTGRKGTLGSYYSVKNYREINPEFGTLEDFDAFVEDAHSLGLKVILDWVANHTSPDSEFTETHPDWFLHDGNGNFVVQHDWTDIAPMDLSNKEMRKEMTDCMRFWLDRGIDGFRCDVAGEMPADYWKEVLTPLEEEYPGRYFLAEGENTELHESGFDASYSWKLHHLLNDIASGKADASQLKEYIENDLEEYPEDAFRLSFTSNHDENSWAGTEFERMGDAWEAMTVLCWTLPKTQPLIYTGQEVGMHHRFQFFEKDPMPSRDWNEYTDFYKYLSELKHNNPALQAGERGGNFELLPSEGNSIRFRRILDADTVTVKVNLEAPWDWDIDCPSDRIERIEPLNWWVGMKTPLQLLIKGKDISSYDLSIEGGRGVKVKQIHKAESPNYLFADIELAPDAQVGTYSLVFRKGDERFSLPYEIAARREGSAERESFSTADAIYLIMPDRFVNGDPDNDNTCATAEKADYEAFFGRHGGDIRGIRSRLDYIEGLGMTAIWNTPLLEDNEPESSYHGYACSDYYHVDSRFGGNFQYRQLVQDAHAHGIKMIMDIVTNHCGSAHWWMQDLPFADWIHQWPEYTHSNCAFSAQNDPYCSNFDRENMLGGWFDTSMPDMNLDNPYVLQYFKQWAVWWIEWADLDGFRVDTYPYNEKYPMSEWCASVRNEYPNINIVGEVWSVNVPQVAYWQAGNPNRDDFDSHLPSIMDFCLHSAICRGINEERVNWDEGMVRIYESISNDVYFNDVSNMMIFPGNHDTDRIGDIVGKDPAKMKIVYTLMATLRGFPQIFAGDELMVTSRDRSQGHGGLRVEFPLGWENDAVQKDLHDYFSTLFRWRRDSDAVQNGRTVHFLTRDNCYAYFRIADKETVFVFVNNSAEDMTVPWGNYEEISVNLPGEGLNVITGEKFNPENCTVPAKSTLTIEFK